MRRTTLIIFLFLLGTIPQTTFAQTSSRNIHVQNITLKDGTVLKGQVIDIEGDIYIIKTQHMGTIEIHLNDLYSITTRQRSSSQKITIPEPGQSNAFKGQVHQMQQSLMKNQQAMSEIQNLTKDPEVMNLLKDPEVMKVLLSMDPVTAQNNPKIQKLMSNPKMQKIITMMMSQQRPQQ